jgi:hypothetical protein
MNKRMDHGLHNGAESMARSPDHTVHQRRGKPGILAAHGASRGGGSCALAAKGGGCAPFLCHG